MKRIAAIHIVVLWLLFCFSSSTQLSAQTTGTPEPLPWDLQSLSQTPEFEWLDENSPVRSLMYAGESFHEMPTQVFAYYASPGTLAGDPTRDKDLPAIVLVHGGGGTAFREWAELWAKRGYAAIAMDLAGSRPIEGTNPHAAENRVRLEHGGPNQGDEEKFGSIDRPTKDQWPYHAVANVILAHSLIRSLDGVDPQRTALTGISWGGYLTCIVAGVDARFKAAVPVYGCGFLHENSAWLERFERMTTNQKNRWIALWDPSRYLRHVSMPILFVNGTNDFAYPLDSYMKSFEAVPGPKELCVTVNMPHGHPPGWAPVEIGRFINHILKGGEPLARVDAVHNDSKSVSVDWSSSIPIKSAELHFTTDTGSFQTRMWKTIEAQVVDQRIVAAAPPENANAWFLTLRDEQDAVVSTRVVLLDPSTE